ncbi:MAG: hypothetical protein HOV97_05125 [Nonomuraea sp.]|nr:hypothetical protein [Nonomuraea sp.]
MLEDQISTPRTALASEQPCEFYLYHAPKPTRTQFHHGKPVYLQDRLYGKVLFGPDTWACGTCHDSVHDWIYFLMGERRRPDPEPGWKTKQRAQATVDWYIAEARRLGKQDLLDALPSAA